MAVSGSFTFGVRIVKSSFIKAVKGESIESSVFILSFDFLSIGDFEFFDLTPIVLLICFFFITFKFASLNYVTKDSFLTFVELP